MNVSDTTPWYRQFWPWFIIALPGAAVIASLYTVKLALDSDDSLVVVSDEGMDVVARRHLAAERRARQMGLDARVSIDVGSGAVTATISSRTGFELPPTVRLEFSHPTDALRDMQTDLVRAMPDDDGNAVWAGHLVTIPAGRYYVVLAAADDWRLSGTWAGEPGIRMLPAGRSRDDDGT